MQHRQSTATAEQPVIVTPETFRDVLRIMIEARRPLFTWGSPGIGKSMQHQAIAAELGMDFIDVRASQWDAVDSRGVPYTYTVTRPDGSSEERTGWAIPDLFPREGCRPTLILFDELNTAMDSVQAALYQLFDGNRALGAYKLPENVVVVAAGNLETDRAVTRRMGTAMASRFFHVQLSVDNDAWTQWALDADIHDAVIAFLRWRPMYLHHFDPKSASKTQPDPRGWEYLSDALKSLERLGITNPLAEEAVIVGKVGEGIGAELVGFMKIYRRLPDPDSVILAPDAAPIDDDPSVNYALCTALARRASANNIGSIIVYVDRLAADPRCGTEFSTLLMRAASAWNPEVNSTREFIAWASKNKDVFV